MYFLIKNCKTYWNYKISINLRIFLQWTRQIPCDKMTLPPQDIMLYTQPTRDCLVKLGTRAFLEGVGSSLTVWWGAMPSPRATTSEKCGSWPRGFTTRGSGEAKVLQSLVMSKGRRGAWNPPKSTELSETLYQQQQQGILFFTVNSMHISKHGIGLTNN